jgi:hypothetical protein
VGKTAVSRPRRPAAANGHGEGRLDGEGPGEGGPAHGGQAEDGPDGRAQADPGAADGAVAGPRRSPGGRRRRRAADGRGDRPGEAHGGEVLGEQPPADSPPGGNRLDEQNGPGQDAAQQAQAAAG